MVIYLAMKNSVRTKVDINKMKAYRQNRKLLYPASCYWKETPMNEEILKEIKEHAHCESK